MSEIGARVNVSLKKMYLLQRELNSSITQICVCIYIIFVCEYTYKYTPVHMCPYLSLTESTYRIKNPCIATHERLCSMKQN